MRAHATVREPAVAPEVRGRPTRRRAARARRTPQVDGAKSRLTHPVATPLPTRTIAVPEGSGDIGASLRREFASSSTIREAARRDDRRLAERGARGRRLGFCSPALPASYARAPPGATDGRR